MKISKSFFFFELFKIMIDYFYLLNILILTQCEYSAASCIPDKGNPQSGKQAPFWNAEG